MNQATKTLSSGVVFQTPVSGDNLVHPVGPVFTFFKSFEKLPGGQFKVDVFASEEDYRQSGFVPRNGSKIARSLSVRHAYNCITRGTGSPVVAIYECPKTLKESWEKGLAAKGYQTRSISCDRKFAMKVHMTGTGLQTRYTVEMVDDPLSEEEIKLADKHSLNLQEYYLRKYVPENRLQPIAIDTIMTVPMMFWTNCPRCNGEKGKPCRECRGEGKIPL